MKLIEPLVSRIAKRTSDRWAICWRRPSSAISSTVRRSRYTLRSITFPSCTTITGSPSRIGRARGKRKLTYDTPT